MAFLDLSTIKRGKFRKNMRSDPKNQLIKVVAQVTTANNSS